MTTHHPHQSWPAAPQPPLPPAPKKARRWPWITGIVAAFVVGTAVGGASGGDATEVAAAAPSAPPTTSPYTYRVPATRAPIATPTPTTQAPVVVAEPEGIGNGTYIVGEDIAPGSYRSPAPKTGIVEMCYFHVKKGDDYLEQGVANEGPSRVTIRESWVGAEFESSGCETWVEAG